MALFFDTLAVFFAFLAVVAVCIVVENTGAAYWLVSIALFSGFGTMSLLCAFAGSDAANKAEKKKRETRIARRYKQSSEVRR